MNRLALTSLTALLLAACGAGEVATEDGADVDAGEQNFSSAEATLLEMEFDGELLALTSWNPTRQVEDQLLYTVGHLNGSRAVARLDRLTVTNVQTSSEGGKTKVKYRAKLPVAWGSKRNLPTSYEFTLPRDLAAQEAFVQKYGHSCVDAGAHDVDAGSMFYYFRPMARGCSLEAADVVKTTATVRVSAENTTGKYPEYHKVWEDQALEIVAIFGKYEDGATTAADAGISAYNEFLRSMKSALARSQLVTTPAELPSAPGVAVPDVTFEATLAGGRKVKVTALLVDNVRTAGAAFDARYASLSPSADVIFYNGHAGLGSNVRALAGKGTFRAGQYQIFFMNGCDTFAYVDGALAEKRARLNPDDPTGTKYMEFITNAMPAFFSSMPRAVMALADALMRADAPKTYEQIFANMDRSQVVVVTGEEDNVFTPGGSSGGSSGGNTASPATFAGIRESGEVDDGEELRFETPALPAGTYLVKLTGTGGDADLYVRAGATPTRTTYDCRPYLNDSNESCTITLTAPKKLHVSIFGYGGTVTFELAITGGPAGGGTSGGSTGPWPGLDERISLARGAEQRRETPALAAGRYVFELSGTGDADLYVKVGAAPSKTTYDCRPFKGDSNERCVVEVPAATTVHLLVTGYAAAEVRLVGRPE